MSGGILTKQHIRLSKGVYVAFTLSFPSGQTQRTEVKKTRPLQTKPDTTFSRKTVLEIRYKLSAPFTSDCHLVWSNDIS